MATKNYKASEIDKVVMEELDIFANGCIDDIQAAAETAGAWAAKKLKSVSPKKSGDYSKEWRVDKKKLRTGTKTTVFNKNLYMLSHLLEYGHAKVNGGRVAGKVFISPVETEANKMFEQEFKKRVENGT